MSSKQIRVILRYAHMVEGALIAVYIYSSSVRANDTYTAFLQFILVPAIIFSGIAMWQLPAFNKWRSQRRRTRAATE